jgi:hypothetical protein
VVPTVNTSRERVQHQIDILRKGLADSTLVASIREGAAIKDSRNIGSGVRWMASSAEE